MECSDTFTRKRHAGFTMVELLVTMGLSGILFASLGQLTFYTGRSFAALTNYAELDNYSRNALDQLTSKIRQSDELLEYSTNRLVFSCQLTNRLTYTYSSSSKTLTEKIGGRERILLKGCTMLNFSIYQRNTEAGTYDQFPATLTNSAAKLVQVSWVCSRDVLGARFNTESVQSAKIVIRNQ